MVCPAGQRPPRSPAQVRAEVVERLQARRAEIEEAILARAFAVSRPTGVEGADYVIGLRAAIGAAVGYGLAGIRHGEESSGPPPPAVLAQARNAARNHIGLEVVLRRYAAGYSVLGDFLQQETRDRDLGDSAGTVYLLQRELTALFDRLVAAVSIDYRHEMERSASSSAERLAGRIRRLLAGEHVNSAELDYDFEAWHLGVIGLGPEVERLLRDLAVAIDRRLLLIRSSEHTIWAWLGGRQKLDTARLSTLPGAAGLPTTLFAIGEPARGLRGWRLTHRQAEAALDVALRCPRPLTRYGDVALLATALRNDDLVRFLTDAYLAPLAEERDGGETFRATLRAFFAAGGNASSAAAVLGVGRQTVTSRLHAIEERIGRPLERCGAEVEVSLRLAELTSGPSTTVQITGVG